MKKPPVNAAALQSLLERFSRRTLVGIVAALVLLIGGYATFNHLLGSRTSATLSAVSEAHKERANAVASELVVLLQPYWTVVDEIAGDEALKQALKAGDTSLEELARQHQPTLDDMLAFRVLPANVRDPQLDAKPPLTFASVAMARAAREQGANVPAEAHLVGSEDEHLALVRRIDGDATEEGSELLGFVHLSVEINKLRQVIADNVDTGTHVELRQGSAVTITENGDEPLPETTPSIARVRDTALSVRLSPTGQGDVNLGNVGRDQTLLLALVAVVCVIAAGIFIVFRGRGGGSVAAPAVVGENVIYQGAIKAILDGAHPGLESLLPGYKEDDRPITITTLEEDERGDQEGVTRVASTKDFDDELPGRR